MTKFNKKSLDTYEDREDYRDEETGDRLNNKKSEPKKNNTDYKPFGKITNRYNNDN
ncbi:hypothetical protein RVBP17_0790 [Pseudomonas phage sp. 30-3]|uniref:Uncharacterized protein n=1 Tax=Pseudomonas phage vB_PaeM_PA5oct TaxID=2163605 RepID=A0A4Y1LUJ5_9CAUD|nr:hypothetical protein PQE65_gp315 [Pseudomonas phage vB_PaeM_PA5oct]WMI31713.1 hypothetical protein GBBBJNDB_00010 [Pseudomonas phage Callisto]WPK39163.1 hypothetical protein Cassandra_0487 [Pseudomonas phage Cassandra]WPK39675.1 hypothetical protein Deiofobo_0478 [Pseudomonas phage Deifobo]WPK40196.1 hypothetical protein ETTORE_0487 [Pseudomonas phage Ettore]WPK40711.1 hypothetical protein Paride_0481 [Pseudomonas phage Paride]VOH53504.1 hypothetical protein MIJ3_00010 [Pseudomonas phage v